jgi:hypothetical protein
VGARLAAPARPDPGNTHGCLVVDAAGNVLVDTDTEAAVRVFAPTATIRVGDDAK